MELTIRRINILFADYDQRVKDFLCDVFNDLVESGIEINNYTYCSFKLLATQLKIYYLASDAVDKENNLYSEDNYKRVVKSPAIQILNKAHGEIMNILQKLSIAPIDKAKLKRISTEEDTSAEELLNELVE